MDEIHVHKTKKSICAHFAESPCISIISSHAKTSQAEIQNVLNKAKLCSVAIFSCK